MAKVRHEQAEQMAPVVSAGYFSLKNDGDSKKVRIMYNGVDDIFACVVHKVTFPNGSFRYVDCLRQSYEDPMDVCPLCAAKNRALAKYFVPIYDIDNDSVITWERGRNFYEKLSDLCTQNNPLVSHIVEIERCGEAGDMNTTYEIYVEENDGTTLEDLPEVVDPIGSIVLEKNAEEMVNFLNTGSFDGTGANSVKTRDTNDDYAMRRRRDVSQSGGVARRRMSTDSFK